MTVGAGVGFSLGAPPPLLIVGLILGSFAAWIAGRRYVPVPSRFHPRIRSFGRDALSILRQPEAPDADLALLRMASAQVRSRLGQARAEGALSPVEMRSLRRVFRRLRWARWGLRCRSVGRRVGWGRSSWHETGPARIGPSTQRVLAQLYLTLHPEVA
jgi:hypothetical protein